MVASVVVSRFVIVGVDVAGDAHDASKMGINNQK